MQESPAAYESLSWAAWWLDDAPTVFDARARAYAGYRRCGDVASAARMATWLACDHLDFRGAGAVAAGWLARARRLLERLPAGPEHGWLSFFEGYLAYGNGDTTRARELALRSAEIGRAHAVADLEMLGLALEGSVLVALGQVREGMDRLDEATAAAVAGEASIPISSAWAFCFLVSACTAVRDYQRAATWCDRIAEFAERYGSRYMLAFCMAEYGAVDLWRGQWNRAEQQLQAAIDDFSCSRPAFVAAPLVALAELRRRQGRVTEALQLLERAGPTGPGLLCRASLALDEGNARDALDLAERYLRQLPSAGITERVPALELLVQAHVACGKFDEAAGALAALKQIVQLVATAPLRVCADLAEGRLATALGEYERARTLLEDAVDGFERGGGAYDAARARAELARTLRGLGRTDAAEREAQRAIKDLVALGAVVDAEHASRLLGHLSNGDHREARLTARERQVLAVLVEGHTNREIAARLVVSEHTVHRHVTSILRKLDVSSRAAAVALIARNHRA